MGIGRSVKTGQFQEPRTITFLACSETAGRVEAGARNRSEQDPEQVGAGGLAEGGEHAPLVERLSARVRQGSFKEGPS